ncbi:MAG: DUF6886 family protein [Phenylobacterium sp.]
MRLFHFSDDPGIRRFEPRPVQVPSERGPGRGWLNGPLVWAIAEHRQAMYTFPRDCPRILLWATADTTDQDRARWFGHSTASILAHIEWDWFERVTRGAIHRYELPTEGFEDLGDAGMWICRETVEPLGMQTLSNIPAALAELGVELRILPSLLPLRDVWSTSLHASGVRLRQAAGWAEAGAPAARLLAPEAPRG